jgi:uncharacterized repeat protein (TIGR01451 family)
MKRSTFNRIPYSIVLAALLLSAVAPASVAPAATPVPAQAPPQAAPPQAPPPPGGAFRLAPPADPPIVPPAAPPAAAPAAAPAPQVAEAEEASDTSPAAPDAPQEACTGSHPTKVSFGQDLELLLGPAKNTFVTYQLAQPRGWVGPSALGNNIGPFTATVGVAAWGTDRYSLLMNAITTTAGNLVSMDWDPGAGAGSLVRQNIYVSGSPVAVARGNDLGYFVRNGAGISFTISDLGVFPAWGTVPGIRDAASDPVVVAPDIYTMKLFYRTSGGVVKFTEWASGRGWRTAPLTLTVGTDPLIASELSAVTRDENHVAVFGVSASNILYVKQWSSANESDWSDTSWVQLATKARTDRKLAVTARHTGHVGVAYMSTVAGTGGNTVPWYREWTAAQYDLDPPTSATRGWKTPVSLGGSLDSVGLVGTAIDEMFAYGVTTGGAFYTQQWTKAGGWLAWSLRGTGWAAPQTVAAVSGRPYDVTFIGRSTANMLLSFHYTTYNQTPAVGATGNTGQGWIRSQVVAKVNAQTYWLSLYRNSTNRWILEMRPTSAWATAWTRDVSDYHGTAAVDGNQAIAAGDVDQDGNDEVIIATIDTQQAIYRYSLYKLDPSAATVIARKSSGALSPAMDQWPGDIQLKIGDLDGDGKDNEVAIATVWSSDNGWFNLQTYRISPDYTWTQLTTQGFAIGKKWSCTDREMAIGKIDNEFGEQLIFSANSRENASPEIQTFRFVPTSTVLSLTHQTWAPSKPDHGSTCGYASSALAMGDVDGDGLEEAVFTLGYDIWVVNLDKSSNQWGPLGNVPHTDYWRSLAVDDVDGDGRAEIVYTESWGGNYTDILKLIKPQDTKLTLIAQTTAAGGVPLLADLDNDSAVATYVDCDEVQDLRVLSVINSQPVWYQDGASVQLSGGGMANSHGGGHEETDGWHTSLGASVTVGFKHEINAMGFKLAEVRASVTQEFIGSFGGGHGREESWTESLGAAFGANGWGLGAVCYSARRYECFNYAVSRPGSTDTTPAQMCTPLPPRQCASDDPTCKPFLEAPQTCMALEDWYSMDPQVSPRPSAGSSWVPVGHNGTFTQTASVDLTVPGNYPVGKAPPVDPWQVWWWDPDLWVPVRASTNPNSYATPWTIEKTVVTSTLATQSFEANTTVSAGADIADYSFDASVTVGAGKEWSQSVTWNTGVEYTGNIYNYPASTVGATNPITCPTSTCRAYNISPFIYEGLAKTATGFAYPYLEQDYFVTYMSPTQTQASGVQANEVEASDAAPQSIVGLVPQAPVVTSATHPDPATWYPTNTIMLNWSQPAGDPAVVIGYKWNISHSPVATPTSVTQLTTTYTYNNAADGVYYLHLQAVGDGGDLGPVTHRAFRVDTGAPLVQFISNPSGPNGLGDWYNTPITFTVAATDTNGSGVAGIETSADGTTWQSYTPIHITADTPGRTLWARATDNLGHVSAPISTTFKLDQTPPSVRDSDRYGLSYANIITDEVGNAQLVLGGALSDTLSGRWQVEVKAGDTGPWNAVSAVGDLPLPSGNWFTTTMTGLQWMYTPTFEIHGAYPIYVRGVDLAGNIGYYYSNTLVTPGGCFWWDPVADPALDESRVSVSPHQAYPGDVVAFTVAARNSGYQEAQYRITDIVPVGLTVLPDSITDGGHYDATTRQIVWTLHAAWPAQTRYLFFKATADSATAAAALENKLDLMSYWPWDRSCDPRVPPEPARHTYSTSTTLTVLPGASMQASAASLPQIMSAAVVEGEIVKDPQVTLLVNASPEARFLYVKEWAWDGTLNTWSLAHESGWVPFEAATGFVVSQDDLGKHGRYDWTLSQGEGVKYLGIWVADANGQISNLNEGNLIYTNLMSASGQQLAAGQRAQYRVPMRADQLAVFTLVSLSGDADLYVWKPRAGLKPHYYSNAAPSADGLSTDTVAFYVPEEGLYVIEVEAATETTYRLVVAGDIAGAGLSAQAQAEALSASTHLSLAEKDRPAHPLTLTTPFSLAGSEQLPAAPEVPKVYKYYFPLIFKQ